MAFTRPTLSELIDRVTSDISTRVLGVDGAVLRRSMLGVIARAEAGAVHMLYGYLDWIARNSLPDTADTELLERWAAIWGITRNAATYSTGDVTFTGTNGTIIPSGTVIQRADGVQYETQADGTIASGTVTIAVEAVVAGADGDLDASSAVFLLSPIAGATSQGTVAAGGLSGGADTETDTRLRERLLERIQTPPQGGSEADYIAWAKETTGVTRVWVTPNGMGAGTVVVQFVTDDDPDGIIPDGATVTAVQDYIDSVRPVTADVYVSAPTAVPLAMTINISPNTAAVQAAIEAELEDLIKRDAEPGGTILISRLREAVSIAAGESDNEITIPAADVTHTSGQIATLGTITFGTL